MRARVLGSAAGGGWAGLSQRQRVNLLRVAIVVTLVAVWEAVAASGLLFRDVVPSLVTVARSMFSILFVPDYKSQIFGSEVMIPEFYRHLWVTVGEVMADTDLAKVSAACATEAFAVARTKGVRLSFDDPVAYTREFASKIPLSRPSVLLDLLAGRKSEIDVINGSIPRVGRQVGVAAPVNEAITALVHAKERQLQCSS